MEQKGCWGYLVPCSVQSPPIELKKTEVVVGRDPGSDILLQGNLLGCKQENISKQHFRMVYGTHGAVIKDDSRTGTFLNSRPIGRGKQAVISHGSRIDIIRPGIKAFMFLDKTVSDSSNHPKNIKDKYIMGHQLGEGGFGQVFLVLDKTTLKRYAMKIVKKTSVAKREAEILVEIKHPCMIRAYKIFTNADHLYLVLEYIAGGDLSRWVNDRKLLSEKQTKLLFYQLSHAVKYMHENSITHRDLKPANILLVSDTPHSLIKVTDFGLAKNLELHSDMTTCAGTEVYLAPEVMFSSPYNNKVDIWSIGVILYYSLSGVLPFQSLSDARRHQHHVMFTLDRWKHISMAAMELVKRMLVALPDRRAGIKEVLDSSWLQDEEMKTEAHTLMGLQIPQSPATPAVKNLLSPTKQTTPQLVRASVPPAIRNAASPVKVNRVSPARLNISPARVNNAFQNDIKTPSPAPQNRQPVTPRGVLQYLSPLPGSDRPRAISPNSPAAAVPRRNQSPNRLRTKSPASPQRKLNPPMAPSPYKPAQFAAAVEFKHLPVHKAQKTFLVEARQNLKPSPLRP